MNKKTLFLVGTILSAMLFIGFLGETEPKKFFGYSVNIWFFRAFWLLNTFIIAKAYTTARKSENDNKN